MDSVLLSVLSAAVGMAGKEDFQPKQISTIPYHTGSSPETKSPQVAVIPPLVDLTKVTTGSDEGKTPSKDEKSKGLPKAFVTLCVRFALLGCIKL